MQVAPVSDSIKLSLDLLTLKSDHDSDPELTRDSMLMDSSSSDPRGGVL